MESGKRFALLVDMPVGDRPYYREEYFEFDRFRDAREFWRRCCGLFDAEVYGPTGFKHKLSRNRRKGQF